MPQIDDLLYEAERENVRVVEHSFTSTRLKGLYCDGIITINKSAQLTSREVACVIAEELGHHHKTSGIILDQTSLPNRKQERRARQWAYERLIPLSRIIDAYRAKLSGRHEVAVYLGVTEEFLQETIDRYRDIYGTCAVLDKKFAIIFEPLSVIEMFEYSD